MKIDIAFLLSLSLAAPAFAVDVVKPAGAGPLVTPLETPKALPTTPGLEVPLSAPQLGVPELPAVPQLSVPGAMDAPAETPQSPAAQPQLDQAGGLISPEAQGQEPSLAPSIGAQVFDGAKLGVMHVHHDETGAAHAHLEGYHRDDDQEPGLRPQPAPFPIPARLLPFVPSAREKNPQDWTDKITLHLHSVYSDGTMEPEAVVEAAYKAGARVIALTDHDTAAGVLRAYKKAQEINAAHPGDKIEFHAGIEMTAMGGAHIGAVDVDITNPKLAALLERVRDMRHKKAEGIIANLNALDELQQKGIVLTIDEVKAFSRHDEGGTIEIPHIARALVKHGLIQNVDDAYQTYLQGDVFNTPGVPPDPAAEEVVETIHAAGGKAFLNHPYTVRGKTDADKDAAVEAILALGVDGIEVYRPSHATSQNGKRLADERTAQYILLTEKHGILVGNGADFHGTDTHLDQLTVWMHTKYAVELVRELQQANQDALAVLAMLAAGGIAGAGLLLRKPS